LASLVDGVSLVVLLELLMLLDTPLLVDESDIDAVVLLVRLFDEGVTAALVTVVEIELDKVLAASLLLLFAMSDSFEWMALELAESASEALFGDDCSDDD
jgi:predicted nucleotidyltransferase